ncbi:hypothetical protein [Flavisphingomonas formosensis]|uniref:hypothetical protein n=1 Tax=Flavisphingomonas formosensis TaxID=861534 RepID=UPI0018E05C61|nr:hypothetical protein [Sphingomonas formosensis]
MKRKVGYASIILATLMVSATWPAIADRRPGDRADRAAVRVEGGAPPVGGGAADPGRSSGGSGGDPIRPAQGEGSIRVGDGAGTVTSPIENPGGVVTKDGDHHAGGDGGAGTGSSGGGGAGGGTGGGHAQGSPAPVAGLGFGALLAIGWAYGLLRRRVRT